MIGVVLLNGFEVFKVLSQLIDLVVEQLEGIEYLLLGGGGIDGHNKIAVYCYQLFFEVLLHNKDLKLLHLGLIPT